MSDMNPERQERRKHQETVCGFVRDVLTVRTGEPITDIWKPEDDRRDVPAVEVIWRGASGVEYAVEHTQLESYEGQIQDQVCIRRVLWPVRLMLESLVPGTFELRVKAGEASAVRGNARDASALIAREVLVSSYGLAVQKARTLRFDEMPLELELYRRHAERSQVFIKCIVEGDSDDLRLNRVRRAIDAKLPKLRIIATSQAPDRVPSIDQPGDFFGSLPFFKRSADCSRRWATIGVRIALWPASPR